MVGCIFLARLTSHLRPLQLLIQYPEKRHHASYKTVSHISHAAVVCAGEALGCGFHPSTPSEVKLCARYPAGTAAPLPRRARALSQGAGNLQVSSSAPCEGDGRHLAMKQTALCCFVFDSALPNNSVAKGSNTAIALPFPKTPNGTYHIIDV